MPFNPERLKQLREQHGLSQMKLANKVRMNWSIINRLESGAIKRPRFNNIEKLANFFKVNMETFRK